MKDDHYLEKSLMSGWQFLTGDVDYMTYGGKWVKQVNEFTYHVIELINMIDATGEENQDTYNVSLQEINLDNADIDAALKSCGWINDDTELNDLLIIDSISLYGQYAPMGNWSGNNYRKLLLIAKRESSQLSDNEEYHHNQLSRPVNRIGSTALEYSQGDTFSAIIRGIAKQDKNAMILGKIQGMTSEDMQSIGPEYNDFTMIGE